MRADEQIDAPVPDARQGLLYLRRAAETGQYLNTHGVSEKTLHGGLIMLLASTVVGPYRTLPPVQNAFHDGPSATSVLP